VNLRHPLVQTSHTLQLLLHERTVEFGHESVTISRFYLSESRASARGWERARLLRMS
jgi:hypothetical protein